MPLSDVRKLTLFQMRMLAEGASKRRGRKLSVAEAREFKVNREKLAQRKAQLAERRKAFTGGES